MPPKVRLCAWDKPRSEPKCASTASILRVAPKFSKSVSSVRPREQIDAAVVFRILDTDKNQVTQIVLAAHLYPPAQGLLLPTHAVGGRASQRVAFSPGLRAFAFCLIRGGRLRFEGVYLGGGRKGAAAHVRGIGLSGSTDHFARGAVAADELWSPLE